MDVEVQVHKPGHQIEMNDQLHVSAVLPLTNIGKAPEHLFICDKNYLFVQFVSNW